MKVDIVKTYKLNIVTENDNNAKIAVQNFNSNIITSGSANITGRIFDASTEYYWKSLLKLCEKSDELKIISSIKLLTFQSHAW